MHGLTPSATWAFDCEFRWPFWVANAMDATVEEVVAEPPSCGQPAKCGLGAVGSWSRFQCFVFFFWGGAFNVFKEEGLRVIFKYVWYIF